MKNYLFISNSSKDNNYLSKDNITLKNMSKCCIVPAQKLNYSVFMSCNRKYANEITVNDYNVKLYDANIYRSIFNIKDNYKAYNNLNNFLKTNKIDVIHCNSPIGGLMGRICGCKNNIKKIIYTAHGFHFFRGNNVIKNILFKSVEKLLAKKTDAIITINQEDYEAACHFKLRSNGKVYFTHGVGININEFRDIKVDKGKKRRELNINRDDFLLISVGDINKNKNISMLLKIIKKSNNKRIKCLVCGQGPLLEKMKKLSSKLNINDQVFFLGYRTDIKELLKISDIFISTSKREGLPRSLMEAMAAGVPCVVSNIRGNRDLIKKDKNGFVCNTINEYVEAINLINENDKAVHKYIKNSLNILKEYDYERVVNEISKIYEDILL